ncbi:MAG: type II toxin-antitoxin system RelE/ParE family toxin [Raoultibacter sp.]
MKRYTVMVTEPAEDDLRDISDYIASLLQAPQAALRFLNHVDKVLQSLEEIPERCPLVQHEKLAIQGYRWIKIGNYVAFFRIRADALVVVDRVLYQKQNWIGLL